MTATGSRATGVHLVGSVPLADAESVFRTVSAALGPHVRRLPDGETGERRRWIFFQGQMLRAHPAMEEDPAVPPFPLRQWDGRLLREITLLRFRPGVDPGTVHFETGYARAAHASYTVFRRLQDAGVIPTGVRFLVCLPTPMATAYMYVSPPARPAYIQTCEHALRQALTGIVARIPAAELSLQWDVCQEVLVREGYFPDRPADHAEQIAAELARLGNAVPEPVELGYHFCYGSPADEPLAMPRDMGLMVEMAGEIRRGVRRPVDFLHLPVLGDRTDEAYFGPLAALADWDADIYLGLVRHDDRAGDRARIRAARRVLARFGVATACGWGRTDPARLPGLLESLRLAAGSLVAGGCQD